MRARLSVSEAVQAGLLPDADSFVPRVPKRKAPGQSAKSKLAETFALQLAASADRLPGAPIREFRFATGIGRKWRFDFAWPDLKIGVEVDGIVVRSMTIDGKRRTQVSGRHAHVTGMREDMHKRNTAMMLGWAVFHGERDLVESGELLRYLLRTFRARGL